MTNLTPDPIWQDVYQIEKTDRVLGGEGGISNVQAQALLNQNLYARKHGGALPFLPGLVYDIGDRVKLDTGEIVISEENGNSSNPNTSLVGWKIDKYVLQNISDLLSINNPKDGQYYYVEHYDTSQGLLDGGGVFIYDSSQSAKNDGGIVFNGWVRQYDGREVNLLWFGVKGDGIKDDYQALYNCFNHHYNPEVGTTDPNALQNQIKSIDFVGPARCYRHTQPLRMPCKGRVLLDGDINYFPRPNLTDQKNRATFFYDGNDLEVAAIYLPVFKRVGGVWQLITDSTEFFTYAAGIPTHPMIRGCEYRFNIITKQKTKIGFNAFGLEAGILELGIGTLGTYLQANQGWTDYAEDDLSPKVGITICTAWNLLLNRCRILAHNQGIFVDGSTGSIVIREGYINRQVSTVASSVTDGFVYGDMSKIPADKQGLTSAITATTADIDFYNVITEGWGCPYVFLGGRYSLFTPHIEGPNDVMMHDFMVYNSKVDLNNWGNVRSMATRANTSIVYSLGMDSETGSYFHMKGSSYYRDNSLFNLVDGVPYDQYTNTAFLIIENVPIYKLISGFFISDLRFIKSISTQSSGFAKYPIYMDTSRTGMKSLGFGAVNAVQTLADLVEAIRILGANWNGVVSLPKGLNINAQVTFDIRPYARSIEFSINAGFSFISANRFMIGCNNVIFSGNGGLVATGPIIEPLSDINMEIKNATVTGSSALIRSDSANAFKHTIRVQPNTNMTGWSGYYVFGTSNLYGFVDLIILGSRSQTIKDREVANNNMNSANVTVTNKIYAP